MRLASINLVLFFFSFVSSSQEPTTNISYRGEIFTGLVIPEYQFVNHLVHKPAYGFELSVSKRTQGENHFDQIYRFPVFGLTFQYTTLGNQSVFGDELALFPFFQVYFNRSKHFKLFNQVGVGVGYVTKKFDIDHNINNIAVGSHFNIHFNYKIGASIQLNEKMSINTSLGFTHFSNANMAEPNLGLNILNVSAGINYSPHGITLQSEKSIPPHLKKHEFDFIYAFGAKHTRALVSTSFLTSSISAEYHYHLRRKFHIGAGIDLFYDSSTKSGYSTVDPKDYNHINDFTSGIHISQELVYRRYSFILQEGIQVGIVNKNTIGKMYNRAIVRCKITDNFLVHISMKSHLHILDYPEIGFGYHFNKSKK